MLLYWGKGGNVEQSAKIIYNQFNMESIDIFDLVSFDIKNIDNYEFLILGSATIGADHWEQASANNEWNKFFRQLADIDLSGKTLAFFGLGDQVLYPENFVDGLGSFEKELKKTKAKIIGRWPIEGYEFTDSEGILNNMFFGLALDENNQWDLTEERAKKWSCQLKKELGY